MSSPIVELYRVEAVHSVSGEAAPPEIRGRFDGRLFTLHELEQRGVRITSGTGWYYATGSDWRLTLAPVS